jgi:predicted MFS family arabinose efflux permease
MTLYVSTALRGITWFGLLTYLGAFLKEEIGLSTSQAGLVYAATGVGVPVGGRRQLPLGFARHGRFSSPPT